jgi:hypothetical protein
LIKKKSLQTILMNDKELGIMVYVCFLHHNELMGHLKTEKADPLLL